MLKLRYVFDIVEEIAPPNLAKEWDKVGLQLGNPDDEAKGVMVALDPSLEAVKEASNAGLNLLLTHHPFFFEPIYSIDLNSNKGMIVRCAIESKVTIFSAHTNLDSAVGGVSDMLAESLGIRDTIPLVPSNQSGNGAEGLGRIGTVAKKMNLESMAAIVKERLSVKSLRLVGDTDMVIERVALCGGSGGDLIAAASRMGADLFISGDIKYHQAREAQDLGIAVIDAGHFSTEKLAVKGLAKILRERFEKGGISIPVKEFEKEEEPFKVI